MIDLPLLHFIVSLFDIQAELNFWQPPQNTSFTVLVGLVQLIFQELSKRCKTHAFMFWLPFLPCILTNRFQFATQINI